MRITATEERLRRHLSCSEPRPEEKNNADSDRTATQSRPWHGQPCAEAARIFSTWLAFVQRKLQQAGMRGKRRPTSFSGSVRPGPTCAYTMLVASDIKKDAYGMEL